MGRIIDDDLNHLASQSGGDYRSPVFSSYGFDEDNITVRTGHFIDLQDAHPREALYSSLDLRKL